MFTLRLLFFLFFLKCVYSKNSNPIIVTEDGKLEGAWLVNDDNRRFAAFKGVPYANPPTGQYRFKDPQPLTPWSGIRNATVYGAACLQLEESLDVILGDEDCLFINIFSPNIDCDARLPVVVFIHGGDYTSGSGDLYDPSPLMNFNMVVITVNYRLGPLGFLTTGDDIVAGNAGLKDQAFALRWIKRNIKYFGGNPDSVTLTGHSTGAACVYFHYLSPWSKGTFHRGIAFSGSTLSGWALDTQGVQKSRELSAVVGCPFTTSQDMVQCLRSKSGVDIAKAQMQTMADKEFRIYSIFQPVIESPKAHNRFIEEHPYRGAVAGKMQKLPLMMTTTREEGLIPAAAFAEKSALLARLNERWPAIGSMFLSYNKTLPERRSVEVYQKIKDFYFNGQAISMDTFSSFVRMETDRVYHASIGKLALIHAKYARVPVYVSEYSFTGTYSISNLLSNSTVIYGAAHTDDILHMWNVFGFRSTSPEDVAMNKVLGEILYNFALTSIPKVTKNVKWEPINPGCKEVRYMEISSPTKFEMRSSSNFGNRTFWDGLGFCENENFRDGYCQ